MNTIPARANERVGAGLTMPGVILVPWSLPIGIALSELALVLGGATDADLANALLYLPL